jgi:hypothetical protein
MHAQTPVRSASLRRRQRQLRLNQCVAPAAASAADAGNRPRAQSASSGMRDSELFVTLRDLLASRARRAGGAHAAEGALRRLCAELRRDPVGAGEVAVQSR